MADRPKRGITLPYQVLQHDRYVEIKLDGVVDSPVRLGSPDTEIVSSVGRILFDYSGITEMKADAYDLAEAARYCEANGLKVAVFAPRPALFGLARQALQLAAVREGESASVFLDRDEARSWLLSA